MVEFWSDWNSPSPTAGDKNCYCSLHKFSLIVTDLFLFLCNETVRWSVPAYGLLWYHLVTVTCIEPALNMLGPIRRKVRDTRTVLGCLQNLRSISSRCENLLTTPPPPTPDPDSIRPGGPDVSGSIYSACCHLVVLPEQAYCSAKTNSGNCSLFKWAVTAVCLCMTLYIIVQERTAVTASTSSKHLLLFSLFSWFE